MIFVDTSIWVDALRGASPTATRLSALLDEDRVALAAPVRVQLLSGASRATLGRLRRTLSALPTHEPTAATWRAIDAWVERAVAAGERFGVGDLLIGAIAVEQGGTVWSKDSDFGRLERLGLLRLHAG